MGHKLAIVDDEENILSSLARYFKLKNFEVDTFSNSQDAFNGIRSGHHKLVLADIDMPGMDGIMLLKKLKRHNPLIQVVIITGNATADNVKQALSNGATGFVVKPFDSLQQLEKEIDKAITIFESAVNKHR